MNAIEINPNSPQIDEDEGLMSKAELEQIFAHYEQKYQMSSEEFWQLREAGNAPDCFDAMNWGILLKYR